jgi:excisionase family DNA binding protein
MPGDMLSTQEVAQYLGIHEKQVYRLLRQGRLPGTRVTGRWIFSRRLVQEWIESCSREAVRPRDGTPAAAPPVEPHHLIITGSDDRLLQTVLREFNRRHPALLATSATLGSVAGIEAVRERRAHVAGIYLLDPASGEYNRPPVAAAFVRQPSQPPPEPALLEEHLARVPQAPRAVHRHLRPRLGVEVAGTVPRARPAP